MVRRVALFLIVASCAHAPARPARVWPPVTLPTIVDAEGIDIALDEHAAIPLGHPQRSVSRAALSAWLIADLNASLTSGRMETAFARFVAALSLYTPEELAGAPRDPTLLEAAERIRVAFARRGAEREVLVAIAARLTFAPTDGRALAQYRMLREWIQDVEPAQGPLALGGRLVDTHEQAARDLPSPFLRDALGKQYADLHASLDRLPRHGLPSPLKEMIDAARPAQRLGAVHLRAGTVATGLAALRGLGRNGAAADDELRGLFEAADAPGARAREFVALALHFAPLDVEAAERACAAGVVRVGQDPDLLACSADLAARRGRIAAALPLARAAVARRPAAPASRQQAIGLMLRRVIQLVDRQRMADAGRVVAEVEAFMAQSRRIVPALRLQPTLGTFLSLLAGGHFNIGDVAQAEALLERALGQDAPPDAFEDLGVIRWRRGRYDEALALYGRAAEVRVPDREIAFKLAARLRNRMGDAHRDKGNGATAREMWLDSVSLWDRYIDEATPALGDDRMNAVAMAEVERAKLFYDLGETGAALDAIRHAIEAAPERGATYVQSVALLTTQGHVAEATDACHRGLAQASVSDYYKVYCALWVYDLARRTRGSPDALAQRYLETVEGDLWHHRLARFMVGRISYADLERQADTPSKMAELYFYEAQNRLAAGQIEEARRLWEKVVQTDMMAFFEYDMALHNLAAHAR